MDQVLKGSEDVGAQMHALISKLYPICRSITGNGVRETLKILSRHIALDISEVPSGTEVLDWVIPKEWNIRDAYIKNLRGQRVVDFQQSSLHVLNYSVPVKQRIKREALQEHLYSLPDHPDWIPYRTSYYNERWGFCLTQKQRDKLTDPEYDVCIDSTLEPGSLTYAEHVIAGETDDEILLTAHICHPSLCNDNLSGIAVATFLANAWATTSRRYTLRLLFMPGTIGSISWLARNRERVTKIRHGLSLVCLGDDSPITFKRTLRGDTELDRVMVQALKDSGEPHSVIDYFPYGYDERQFNSPGFGLAFGSVMRGQHGKFPEYHTSGDHLGFVKAERLEQSLSFCVDALTMLDDNRRYLNLYPYGEPQLGKRGVYRALGGQDIADTQLSMFWVLALSDGKRSLVDVAERSGLPFSLVRHTAKLLEQHQVLAESSA